MEFDNKLMIQVYFIKKDIYDCRILETSKSQTEGNKYFLFVFQYSSQIHLHKLSLKLLRIEKSLEGIRLHIFSQ